MVETHSRGLYSFIIAKFDRITYAHWSRMHRGGVVYLTAQALDLPEERVHEVINYVYGEVELDSSFFPVPDERDDNDEETL